MLSSQFQPPQQQLQYEYNQGMSSEPSSQQEQQSDNYSEQSYNSEIVDQQQYYIQQDGQQQYYYPQYQQNQQGYQNYNYQHNQDENQRRYQPKKQFHQQQTKNKVLQDLDGLKLCWLYYTKKITHITKTFNIYVEFDRYKMRLKGAEQNIKNATKYIYDEYLDDRVFQVVAEEFDAHTYTRCANHRDYCDLKSLDKYIGIMHYDKFNEISSILQTQEQYNGAVEKHNELQAEHRNYCLLICKKDLFQRAAKTLENILSQNQNDQEYRYLERLQISEQLTPQGDDDFCPEFAKESHDQQPPQNEGNAEKKQSSEPQPEKANQQASKFKKEPTKFRGKGRTSFESHEDDNKYNYVYKFYDKNFDSRFFQKSLKQKIQGMNVNVDIRVQEKFISVLVSLQKGVDTLQATQEEQLYDIFYHYFYKRQLITVDALQFKAFLHNKKSIRELTEIANDFRKLKIDFISGYTDQKDFNSETFPIIHDQIVCKKVQGSLKEKKWYYLSFFSTKTDYKTIKFRVGEFTNRMIIQDQQIKLEDNYLRSSTIAKHIIDSLEFNIDEILYDFNNCSVGNFQVLRDRKILKYQVMTHQDDEQDKNILNITYDDIMTQIDQHIKENLSVQTVVQEENAIGSFIKKQYGPNILNDELNQEESDGKDFQEKIMKLIEQDQINEQRMSQDISFVANKFNVEWSYTKTELLICGSVSNIQKFLLDKVIQKQVKKQEPELSENKEELIDEKQADLYQNKIIEVILNDFSIDQEEINQLLKQKCESVVQNIVNQGNDAPINQVILKMEQSNVEGIKECILSIYDKKFKLEEQEQQFNQIEVNQNTFTQFKKKIAKPFAEKLIKPRMKELKHFQNNYLSNIYNKNKLDSKFSDDQYEEKLLYIMNKNKVSPEDCLKTQSCDLLKNFIQNDKEQQSEQFVCMTPYFEIANKQFFDGGDDGNREIILCKTLIKKSLINDTEKYYGIKNFGYIQPEFVIKYEMK